MTSRPRTWPIAWLLIQPIRFYQRFISRYTPPTCRYYPCCSSYAIGALRIHGAPKGLLLGSWRLLRCNPWSSGGVDHVPPRGRWRAPECQDADTPGDQAAVPAPASARIASTTATAATRQERLVPIGRSTGDVFIADAAAAAAAAAPTDAGSPPTRAPIAGRTAA